MVWTLAEELNRPIKPGGSVTLRRRKRQRGLEADRSFWIANAFRMQGRRRLDLRTDPPPDLAIEIDVTHATLDRMSIYAALRIPEVWTLAGDILNFHVLQDNGTYSAAPASLSFPMVTPADLMHFVLEARQAARQRALEW